MIKKLLWKTKGKSQLVGAAVGALIGFVLLLISVQFYLDLNQIFKKDKDLISRDHIIINKKVSIVKTLNISSSDFTNDEIEEIKNLEFVENVSPFVASNFQVFTKDDSESRKNFDHPFSFQLFFEAVPDEFIDINTKNWKVTEKENVIPIILPKEYLNLYNFGFAQTQNVPQFSENTISLLRFKLYMRGAGKTRYYTGRIAGFSDRINTFLVPYDFLIRMNKELSNEETKISRLIIITKKPGDPELLRFIEEKNYDTNKDKLKSSKIAAILKGVLFVSGSVAVIIIFLSFLVFAVSFQLIITKSSEKLRILVNIGYHYLTLSKIYIKFFVITITAINLLSFIILYFIHRSITSFLFAYGFEIDPSLSIITVIFGILISIFLAFLNSISIIKHIKNINS